ncbi:MAG: GH3 auxin-responsive promoter family protein [Candidatus Brockarchaeota archaeon]|nr:GH3 auxin-responsive promoter family protein [Candidatus Brockarchaeota archaeon]
MEVGWLSGTGPFLESWYDSLRNPREAQQRTLENLLSGYRKTRYGAGFSASEISSIEDFRKKFPIAGYDSFLPYLDEVAEGRHEELLPEPAKGWVMTRGTTGPPKLFPVTDTHLGQILRCGSRAVLNYARRKDSFEILSKPVLNLSFPSRVGQIKTIDGKAVSYGYSSGTYARLNPGIGSFKLVPSQEEVDSLGSGGGGVGWTRRFELAFEKAKGLDVGALIGVAPLMVSFARYLRRTRGFYPKKVWNVKALFCTSVPKIQVKYAPYLKRLYGDADVVEIYSATEGVFAQQLDELPYVSPNYDSYLFEVSTSKGLKMLHELGRGEWGRVIISSCVFPRYDIGDLVESFGRNCFRIIGRAKASTILEHVLHRALTWWLF